MTTTFMLVVILFVTVILVAILFETIMLVFAYVHNGHDWHGWGHPDCDRGHNHCHDGEYDRDLERDVDQSKCLMHLLSLGGCLKQPVLWW